MYIYIYTQYTEREKHSELTQVILLGPADLDTIVTFMPFFVSSFVR